MARDKKLASCATDTLTCCRYRLVYTGCTSLLETSTSWAGRQTTMRLPSSSGVRAPIRQHSSPPSRLSLSSPPLAGAMWNGKQTSTTSSRTLMSSPLTSCPWTSRIIIRCTWWLHSRAGRSSSRVRWSFSVANSRHKSCSRHGVRLQRASAC